jgi:DNA-binding MarR family transcriptional regulator
MPATRMSIDSFDFILSSETRFRVLSFLSRSASTPTQLAKEIEKHLSHISRALRELESKDLVSCQSPKYAKPRVYYLTPEGDRLLREVTRYRVRLNIL